MKEKIDTVECTYVCVTPIKVKGTHTISFGESTILAPEKNLIVVKKNKGAKK